MATQAKTIQPEWIQHYPNGLKAYVYFDEVFSATPSVVAALKVNAQEQPPTTGIRILNPTQGQFEAIVESTDGTALSPEEAERLNWQLSYIASTGS